MFSVDVTQERRGVVLAPRGEFDSDSVVQSHEAAENALVAGVAVSDRSALTFCDSSGIGALLRP